MTPIISLFTEQPIIFYSFVFILGLVIGSFLNVVIFRLPQRMQQELAAACTELNGAELDDEEVPSPSNKWFGLHYLITPASTCPHCQHEIRAWENIPVLSYLLLKGQCSNCQQAISIQYPIIEMISGLLALVVALKFGVSWQTVAVLILSWGLLTMSMIDIEHQLLPDVLTLPLLWLGLLVNYGELFTTLELAVVGAVAGYLALWLVYHIFYLLTDKEGMGYGDFKLFALFGAWTGWQLLPQILLLSSLVGAIVGISLILLRGRDRNIPIPFGPYLAIAGWVALLWGEKINQTYLQFAGLG